MILRFIIFILIGFLLYYLIKMILRPHTPERRKGEEASEMVLDHYCGKYILKSDALKRVMNGNDIFFCNKECMEDFEKKAKNM